VTKRSPAVGWAARERRARWGEGGRAGASRCVGGPRSQAQGYLPPLRKTGGAREPIALPLLREGDCDPCQCFGTTRPGSGMGGGQRDAGARFGWSEERDAQDAPNAGPRGWGGVDAGGGGNLWEVALSFFCL
jgi:hypothetical protein